AVGFHFEDVSFDLPHAGQLTEWLRSIARAESKPFIEVNYIFCSDEYLRKVNVEYLDHDYYTDIITFPYGEAGEIHGDLFISSERVADNAQTLGVSFQHELCRVMAHGVLHLAGYGDKSPEEEALMRQKEDFYLQQLDNAALS
ncbi:MAG TPA: rRNA maturation RNase YbeY, partial [Saprospiraceae bacterium]|nr:rRNA maturation RNase YbeY [Saprospiraceae bacterium]